MKKRFFLLLYITAALIYSCVLPAYGQTCDVSAHSAVLIEASDGTVIYEKDAHRKLPMASTTKIMTAVVALATGDISREVKIDCRACGVEGSSIYLKPNEVLTLEDLLYALMLESANDAAAAIAYEISGGIEEFASLMNETAAKIGLSGTHFTNPHGLDNEAHYTTAYDLGKLTAYAMSNTEFQKIVSTYKKIIPLCGEDGVRVLINHNKLLKMSDDVIGVKTGFTKHSGRCLVSAAEKDGVCVIAVTLNAPDDWNDHLAMHKLGFAEYESKSLAKPGEFVVKLPCSGAPDGFITARNRDALTHTMPHSADFTYSIEAQRPLLPQIDDGQEVGRVVFFSNGKEIGSVALYSDMSVEEPPEKHRFLNKVLDLFN